MSDLIIPTVGSSGYFELRAPLENLIVPNEQYTCQAVRRLSDYLANNEVPKTDIYDLYGIPEVDYNADLQSDMYIASLQSDKGHWLYIPARYIINYPITNGIPYRTVMIGISLPSMPVTRDLTAMLMDIGNLVTDTLGVTPVIKQVETSRVVLVDSLEHDTVSAQRAIVSAGRVTDRSRYMSLLNNHQLALAKITQLEQYLKEHHI